MTTTLTPGPDKRPRYVLGFMFNEDTTRIALLIKQRPLWQKDLLNGMGGRVLPGESVADAMVRTFQKETGFQTLEHEWSHFATVSCFSNGIRVDCFCARGNILALRSTTDELVVGHHAHAVHLGSNLMIKNLPWIIALAHDHLNADELQGQPAFARIEYP